MTWSRDRAMRLVDAFAETGFFASLHRRPERDGYAVIQSDGPYLVEVALPVGPEPALATLVEVCKREDVEPRWGITNARSFTIEPPKKEWRRAVG